MIVNHYDDAVLPPELVQLVELTGTEARRVRWSGNPPFAPYVYGWTIRFGRHTSPEEKWTLRWYGFWFSGGQWKRSDASEENA